MNFVQDYGDSWKRMYLERYLQQHLEKLPVEDYKLVEIKNLMKLLSPYVHRLRLRELQLIKSQQELDAVANAELKAERKKLADEEEIVEVTPAPRPPEPEPPEGEGKKKKKKRPESAGKGKKKDEEPPAPEVPQPRPLTPPTPDEAPPEVPDPCVPRHDIPLDHINLEPVIRNLAKLQEFTVAYGIRDCGMEYRRELFQFSVQDMKNLGRGLEVAYALRVFRLTRSNLDDTLSPDLVRSLSKVIRLKILDLSHCRIGDNTACALGHLITKHPRVELIDLTNNCIGQRGAKGLAYALQHPPCAPVRELHLRLNRIGDGGAAAMAAMLERARLPSILNLAACDITSEGAMHMAVALRHNHTLRRLNLSNNPLGDSGGEHLESAMRINSTLIDLDLRMTNMPAFREYVIMVEVDANNAKYRRLYTEIKEMLKKESEERILRGLLAKAVALETDEEWLGAEVEKAADDAISGEPTSIYWQV
ncbi:Uncharacterized protein GBIM_04267 [Gryllus bimaculatus]|nr:Uncharacterized protein GBIM_04267 [Gryllus bimaculatus]